MNSRKLGKTGLLASEASLGTAEIGIDYGFKGSSNYSRPTVQNSIRLIQSSINQGVNWLDTARAYGNSEEIIGQALRDVSPKPYIASKVIFSPEEIGTDSVSLREVVFRSIEESLRALQIDSIALLHIHNATPEILRYISVQDALSEAQSQGKIQHIGATCYQEEGALAVMDCPLFSVIQVPFNLLNQQMSQRVFPEAAKRNIGIFVRSAFLRGVLTDQINSLPVKLAPLRHHASQILDILGSEVSGLAEAAIRFCLSFPEISSVLMGLKNEVELQDNLSSFAKGALPEDLMSKIKALPQPDPTLADPLYWEDLI